MSEDSLALLEHKVILIMKTWIPHLHVQLSIGWHNTIPIEY